MHRLLVLFLVLWVASAQATQPDRRIAITIDDLPWAHLADVAPGEVPAQHAQLMRALKDANAPVTGFVNESKLEHAGTVLPERERMLEDWLDAGAELGNHGYAHLDLHAVGMADYTADILRGEKRLRPMLARRGTAPRWFRHPYLRAGRTAEDKAALASFLHEHGYRIAPVSVDNSDWIWAGAYRNVLKQQTPDAAVLERLRRDYVPYMLAKIDYYEQQSQALLGYNVPHVWLLHANALNAATYVALVDGVRARGYRIIALEEALRDPAYEREDGYTGAYGPSWIHRWAMAEKKPGLTYGGEPRTPQWVLDLADVDSE